MLLSNSHGDTFSLEEAWRERRRLALAAEMKTRTGGGGGDPTTLSAGRVRLAVAVTQRPVLIGQLTQTGARGDRIDGVDLRAGDVFLATAQANASENGLWRYAGGRAEDSFEGMLIRVNRGAEAAGWLFVCMNAAEGAVRFAPAYGPLPSKAQLDGIGIDAATVRGMPASSLVRKSLVSDVGEASLRRTGPTGQPLRTGPTGGGGRIRGHERPVSRARAERGGRGVSTRIPWVTPRHRPACGWREARDRRGETTCVFTPKRGAASMRSVRRTLWPPANASSSRRSAAVRSGRTRRPPFRRNGTHRSRCRSSSIARIRGFRTPATSFSFVQGRRRTSARSPCPLPDAPRQGAAVATAAVGFDLWATAWTQATGRWLSTIWRTGVAADGAWTSERCVGVWTLTPGNPATLTFAAEDTHPRVTCVDGAVRSQGGASSWGTTDWFAMRWESDAALTDDVLITGLRLRTVEKLPD